MSQVKLTADTGGGTTSIKGPAQTTGNADVVFKLPIADGSSGEVLKTDGSGQLSFTSNAGTTINNNADNRVITGSGTANTLNGESSLTYGGTELLISNSSPSVKLNDTDNSGVVDINNVGGAAVYQSTGDAVFETNGSERLRIDSSGRVLIGLNANAANASIDDLQVGNPNSSTQTGITIGSNDEAAIAFANNGDARAGSITYNMGSDAFIFKTNGQNERIRIDSSGKVGIGTTSPTEPLHVNGGDICISHTAAPNLRIVKADNSSGSASNRAFFGLASGGNNYMNGTGDGDTCIVGAEGSLQHMHFGFGNSIKLTLRDDGRIFNAATYNNTTSSSANMSMPNNTGEFFRSTSSKKYKDNIVTLTDELADKILNCRPVSYTSTCAADDKTKIFYGMIAEEVHEVDSSLVLYNNEPETPEPEGVQYDRFVPALINLVKRQKGQIETLEAKVAALEAA